MKRRPRRDTSVGQRSLFSVFTGSGGMDLGFQAAGFEPLLAIEHEGWACETLRRNHPKLEVIGPPAFDGDVNNISGADLLRRAGLRVGGLDVLIGGPPCQPFSQASTQRFVKTDPRFKRQGYSDETRGNLLFEFVRLVAEIKPRVFVLENVPGIATIDGGEQLQLALRRLGRLGYGISAVTPVEAARYGVPQLRKRLILWGSRKLSSPTQPPPTHGGDGDDLFFSPLNTVAHALVNLKATLPNHVTREHKENSLVRYKQLRFGERDLLGRADRLDPFKPSKTVIAGGLKGGGRSHLHPFVARTLSVRESARLQTFPDTFVFEGSTARQFTQVGNAVPPLLAEQFARHIMSEEFGGHFSGGPRFEVPLLHGKSVPRLVAQLLAESKRSMPNWLYEDASLGALLEAG